MIFVHNGEIFLVWLRPGFHLNPILTARKRGFSWWPWVNLFFRSDVGGGVFSFPDSYLFFFLLSTCSPLDWNMCTSTKTTAYRTHNLFFRRKCGGLPLLKIQGDPLEGWDLWPFHRYVRSQTEQLEFVELDFQQGELWHTAPRCFRNGSTFRRMSSLKHDETALISPHLHSDLNVTLNHIILTMAVWAELMHLIYVPVCILICVLWDVCGSPENDITVLLNVALGIVRSSNIWILQEACL